MSDIKTLVTPNDFGPRTVTRARLSRSGSGPAALIVKGNPFSFALGPFGECIPFLSLAGGKNAQSQAVRDALLQGEADSQSGNGSAGPAADTGNGNNNQTTNTVSNPPAGNGSGGDGGGHYASTAGPLGYINASKTGHR